MQTTIIRLMSILGSVLLLLAVLIALLRLYPYTPHFPAYPRITHTQSGAEGDPLNLVFVGSQEQITRSFHQAGWLIPDPITPQTSEKIAIASLAHRSYPTAPVSNLYVFGRVQDLAFEKPTNDVANRGHIRLWKTGTLIGGQLVWIGQASYDSGIELSGTSHLPTHHIAPTVDLERNAVGADLEKTGLVKEEADAAFTPPIVYARNGGGDYYESDGDVLVINYTQAPIPLTPPAWVIDGLKNGVFLVYDALFTIVGALIAFLVLVAVLIAGLMLWRLTERNRTLERK
jgi:LssY-like putative type I secretion system component LssY